MRRLCCEVHTSQDRHRHDTQRSNELRVSIQTNLDGRCLTQRRLPYRNKLPDCLVSLALA